MLALYPLIGLPIAIGVYVYARRRGERGIASGALAFAGLFLLVLIVRLAVPA